MPSSPHNIQSLLKNTKTSFQIYALLAFNREHLTFTFLDSAAVTQDVRAVTSSDNMKFSC